MSVIIFGVGMHGIEPMQCDFSHAIGLLRIHGKFHSQALHGQVARVGVVVFTLDHLKQHAMAKCALCHMQGIDFQ